MTRRVQLVGWALAVLVCTAPGSGCHRPDALWMVAGQEASGDAAAGRALAASVRARAGFDITVEATAGYTESLTRLGSGRADLALAPADLLADAVNGQGTFRGAMVNARAIATLANASLHLVVRRDSPISGLSGLRGRRVATGPSGSATELTALRVLRTALLDPEGDVRCQPLDLGEAIVALRERRIDALFWLGAVPVPALHDATSGHRAQPLPIKLLSTASVVPLLQTRFGAALYSVVERPGAAYGSSEPWAAASVPVLLISRPELPDTVARELARSLLSDANARKAHPLFSDVSRDRASRPSPAALHPGAARYYSEAGR